MKCSRIFSAIWIVGICLLYAAHLLHLRADFPNFSPWMDFSKYTDEGWYGSAAVRHFLSGSWRLPGDFNPAAALPVWPLLEGIAFRLTGVSIVAARVLVLLVFAGNLLLTYALVRTAGEKRWIALLAVTFLAASDFLYAFSRLAILEPLLIFWMLLSWLLALKIPAAKSTAIRCLLAFAIGLVLCLQVLTKTTAVFLLPAIICLLWRVSAHNFRRFAESLLITSATAGLCWSAYYFLLIRPHYASDYHYLFLANQWDHPSGFFGWLAALWYALHGILWVDIPLTLLAAALLVLTCFIARRLWTHPLFPTLLLAIGGYIFFIAWHESMEPRYYQVIAFPLTLAICLATGALWKRLRWTGAAAAAVLVLSTGLNLRVTLHYVRNPEYSFVDAAEAITRYIDQHPNGNRLLLSISGANITLITHLPSICDDFGTYDLQYRIHQYKPGWYAAWNELDEGTLDDLQTQYSLEKVAEYYAFDNDDRDTLVLYKLHPLPPEKQNYDEDDEKEANAGK